ncbi:MAG: hypothetical protein AAGA70_00385 [Pseudomonadota bacterium]
MAFLVSAILLVVFVANVSFGAVNGDPVLNNVTEMLILFGAAIAFVAAILKREAEANRAQDD